MTESTERFDIVIVGGGPAGLSAAATALDAGQRVLIVDQGMRLGGQIWRHRDHGTLPRHAQQLIALAARANIWQRARVVDVLAPGLLIVEHDGGGSRVEYGSLILATGARERFIPFPGWTLPGIVGVGGLQALIKSGVSVQGSRIVIAGSGPLLFPVAATAARAGATVQIVAEQASVGSLVRFGRTALAKPGLLLQAAKYRWAFRAAPFQCSSWLVRAEGDERVRTVTLSVAGRVSAVDCDWVATGGGLVPNTDLAELLGCRVEGAAIMVDAAQATSIPGVYAAGECTGIKGDAAAIAEGAIAAATIVARPIQSRHRHDQRRGQGFAALLARCFAIRAELRALADATTVICRCENVRRGELDPSWTQRQAKLWTRLGMGECQGAVCGPVCGALFGWESNRPRSPLGAPECSSWSDALRVTS